MCSQPQRHRKQSLSRKRSSQINTPSPPRLQRLLFLVGPAAVRGSGVLGALPAWASPPPPPVHWLQDGEEESKANLP